MTEAAQDVLDHALELDEAERAELAAALLESLEPQADPIEIEAAWRAEVRRRVEAADAGRAEAVRWETVRDELFARMHAASQR